MSLVTCKVESLKGRGLGADDEVDHVWTASMGARAAKRRLLETSAACVSAACEAVEDVLGCGCVLECEEVEDSLLDSGLAE